MDNAPMHTPGPWVVIDNRHMNDAWWIGVDQFTTHAEVRSGCDEADELGDMEANARLIATAPELLAALQGAINILGIAESNASGNPEWDYVGPRVAACRAAIAKATKL